MIDITKDEFWENRVGEVSKVERSDNKVKRFIIKHKLITLLLLSLGLLMTINTILIYNFFKILTNI